MLRLYPTITQPREVFVKFVRSFAFVLFALLCALTTIQAASAQSDSLTCGSFSNDQAAAQEYFDANGQPDSLDGDGDGQACASPEDGDYTGGPSAGPSGPSAGPEDITCGHFNNDQAAAQEYFEANGQPSNLDGDGDGQACASPEDGDYTSTGPSAGPEDASTSTEDDTSADSEAISDLPSTGSGSALPAASNIGILLGLSIIVGAGALQMTRSLRR